MSNFEKNRKNKILFSDNGLNVRFHKPRNPVKKYVESKRFKSLKKKK